MVCSKFTSFLFSSTLPLTPLLSLHPFCLCFPIIFFLIFFQLLSLSSSHIIPLQLFILVPLLFPPIVLSPSCSHLSSLPPSLLPFFSLHRYKKTQETLSQAGQKTSAALSTVGTVLSRKLGDMRYEAAGPTLRQSHEIKRAEQAAQRGRGRVFICMQMKTRSLL